MLPKMLSSLPKPHYFRRNIGSNIFLLVLLLLVFQGNYHFKKYFSPNSVADNLQSKPNCNSVVDLDINSCHVHRAQRNPNPSESPINILKAFPLLSTFRQITLWISFFFSFSGMKRTLLCHMLYQWHF